MLPSLWTYALVMDYFQLLDPSQHFWNPQSPKILRQEYEVGAVHELKPMSEPLSVPVE